MRFNATTPCIPTPEGWGFTALFEKRYWITISNFEGWPDGPLADEIRQHAPHLFEAL